jgi:small subunit ribosomal protein S24e
MYKVPVDTIVVFGVKTKFGGGRSTGFALLYDSPADMKKFDSKHRVRRVSVRIFLISTILII